jgi:hypothetical protein
MSKLSFRARALDASKPMPIYMAEELPDLPDYSAINRAVPQMPSGMEKEEECVSSPGRQPGVYPPSCRHIASRSRSHARPAKHIFKTITTQNKAILPRDRHNSHPVWPFGHFAALNSNCHRPLVPVIATRPPQRSCTPL